jgi:ubiquinone/menaquinone biosynthesis C-methylase UbiE
MSAKDHYENHLGNFYSWMSGDFNQKQLEQQEILNDFRLAPITNGAQAIDLGSGHGIQSIALANLGYSVTAVDFNRQLLKELSVNRNNLPINIQQADVLEYLTTHEQKTDLIVCMGDTLTHLLSPQDVTTMLALCHKRLNSNGKLMLSFRDLTEAVEGARRFIFVRGDDARIVTCFLEYFEDHVQVHDIFYVKTESGWKQTVSSYPKLRLSPAKITEALKQNGFKVLESKNIKGMDYMLAQKI